MDYLINIDSMNRFRMTFDAVTDIRNNILLSLSVKKGSFFLIPEFGSRLHEITSNSISDLNLAAAYAKESLLWMIKTSKLTKNDVYSVKMNDGIELNIVATSLNGNIVPYTYYHRIT